ncbi:hypothetical protein EON79_21180 [bacterium]|nr:MAG: hypothetical protein EON79_21180 [bacterium]
MAVENRLRTKYGIRRLDAGWRWVGDYEENPYGRQKGIVGSTYERQGPYGRETKSVERDRRTGELVSDTDTYLSGRGYVQEWEDGHPTVEESLTVTFYYRTGKLGETVDGDWYPSVIYSGDEQSLHDATFGKESFTVREVDRLVAEMRRKAGKPRR